MQRWADRLFARGLSAVALLSLVAAFAYLVQPAGDNQNAHYALTRALADGRPYVDEIRGTGPERLQTNDVVEFEGHLYAAKAPGLAATALPAYGVAVAAGARTTGDPKWMEWLLHLWVTVLPAAVLLAIVSALGDRVAAGGGVAGAVVVGGASLVLPFSQLFFAHLLATALGLAAFALAWRDRAGAGRPVWAAAAGGLAGLAVTVDYPLGLVAIAVGLYVLARPQARIPHAAAYALGLALGVLPAFAFNFWAFGSPLHFPYEGWTQPGGEPYPGVFGINRPSLSVLLQLLFVPGGIAPILAPALIGLVVMWRQGLRDEAATIGGLAAGYVLYNASSSDPFGGASPGPRYLVPLLPFLAIPLAAAVRRATGVVLGLATGAGAIQALYSVTSPLAAWDGQAWERLRASSVVETVLEPVGVPAGPALVPFGLLLLASAAAALVAARVRVGLRDLLVAAVSLGGWAVVTWQTPRLVDEGTLGQFALIGLAALVAASVAAAATVSWLPRAGPVPVDSPPFRR